MERDVPNLSLEEPLPGPFNIFRKIAHKSAIQGGDSVFEIETCLLEAELRLLIYLHRPQQPSEVSVSWSLRQNELTENNFSKDFFLQRLLTGHKHDYCCSPSSR